MDSGSDSSGSMVVNGQLHLSKSQTKKKGILKSKFKDQKSISLESEGDSFSHQHPGGTGDSLTFTLNSHLMHSSGSNDTDGFSPCDVNIRDTVNRDLTKTSHCS